MTVVNREGVFLRTTGDWLAWSRQADAQWLADQEGGGSVGGAGGKGGPAISPVPAPPIDLYRWPGHMVCVSDAPTTVASAGGVPVGGPAPSDPGRAVLGVAPFAISDGDGSLPDPESRPGSGGPSLPQGGPPRPVRLAVLRRRP